MRADRVFGQAVRSGAAAIAMASPAVAPIAADAQATPAPFAQGPPHAAHQMRP